MIQYELEECQRKLLLTLKQIDRGALRRILEEQIEMRMQTSTLPKVSLELSDRDDLAFYPDHIRITLGTQCDAVSPMQCYQTLRFDELFGISTPIVIKKEDERKARMDRVRLVLDEFNEGLNTLQSGMS